MLRNKCVSWPTESSVRVRVCVDGVCGKENGLLFIKQALMKSEQAVCLDMYSVYNTLVKQCVGVFVDSIVDVQRTPTGLVT